MKAAVLVFSDPASGSEEALGRLYNALSTTYQLRERGDDVKLVFAGAGTRWAAELAKADHPARALYEQIADRVHGASCACAAVFGAEDAVRQTDVPLLEEFDLPGVGGVAGVGTLVADGYQILSF